jgi:hypothetical protein
MSPDDDVGQHALVGAELHAAKLETVEKARRRRAVADGQPTVPARDVARDVGIDQLELARAV